MTTACNHGADAHSSSQRGTAGSVADPLDAEAAALEAYSHWLLQARATRELFVSAGIALLPRLAAALGPVSPIPVITDSPVTELFKPADDEALSSAARGEGVDRWGQVVGASRAPQPVFQASSPVIYVPPEPSPRPVPPLPAPSVDVRPQAPAPTPTASPKVRKVPAQASACETVAEVPGGPEGTNKSKGGFGGGYLVSPSVRADMERRQRICRTCFRSSDRSLGKSHTPVAVKCARCPRKVHDTVVVEPSAGRPKGST